MKYTQTDARRTEFDLWVTILGHSRYDCYYAKFFESNKNMD